MHVPGPAEADQKHSNARLPRRLLVGPLSAQPWPAAAGAILLGTGLAPVDRQRHPHLDDRPATAVAAGPGHVHHRPPRPRPAAAPAGAAAAIGPPPPSEEGLQPSENSRQRRGQRRPSRSCTQSSRYVYVGQKQKFKCDLSNSKGSAQGMPFDGSFLDPLEPLC